MSSKNQQTEYFNQFLNGSLSEEEENKFLKKLESDKDFKSEFEIHKEIVEGIKRFGVRREVIKAYHSYRKFIFLKYFVLGSLVLLIVLSVYFISQYKTNDSGNNIEVSSLITDSVKEINDTLPYMNSDSLSTNEESDIEPKAQNDNDGLEILYKSWRKKPNVFNIDNSKDIVLSCKEGTKIEVKANSFRFKSGKEVNGIVKLYVTEYYTKKDFIKANLGTVSDGRLLESGGMLYIEARSRGQKLEMKEDVSLGVLFVNDKPRNNMSLFTGDKKNGAINWNLVKNDKTTEVEIDEVEVVSDLITQDSMRLLREEERKQQEQLNKNLGFIKGVPRMGWINCDRFYNNKGKTVNFGVNLKEFANQKVLLIFDEINSQINGYIENNKTKFFNITEGLSVTILAIAHNNGEYYLSETKERAKTGYIEISYRKVSKSEINKYLTGYNN